MSRFDKAALAATIIVLLLCFGGGRRFLAYQYYLAQIRPAMLPVAVVGWGLVTFGPILLAALFWRRSRSASAPWIFHLLLLPGCLILLWAGDALMLSAITDPDFDATLDEPDMPGFFLFVIALCGYYTAFVADGIARARNLPDDG